MLLQNTLILPALPAAHLGVTSGSMALSEYEGVLAVMSYMEMASGQGLFF